MQDEQITLRLPKVLALKARRLAEAEGYGSLSDLVRDAVRERIRRSVERSLRDVTAPSGEPIMSEDEVDAIVHETRKRRRTSQIGTRSNPKTVHA